MAGFKRFRVNVGVMVSKFLEYASMASPIYASWGIDAGSHYQNYLMVTSKRASEEQASVPWVGPPLWLNENCPPELNSMWKIRVKSSIYFLGLAAGLVLVGWVLKYAVAGPVISVRGLLRLHKTYRETNCSAPFSEASVHLYQPTMNE